MASSHYDVIIIGTGAGGGTLAYRLAPSGKRILLIERGDYVSREPDNWSTRAVNVDGKYQTKEKWRDRAGKDLHPHTNYAVGGNTKFYGAALFRLRREDFGALQHHGGISPAWPIDYDDLEPYYTEAEHLYQVHGARGEDPTEPPASSEYRYPAVTHEPRIQQLSDDFARLGYKPFHTPLGIMLDERNRRRSRCIRCGTCDGHPCLVNAKSDAQVVCVDPALEHENVSLLTNAYVTRLDSSPSGREVTRVLVEREGRRETYSADIVVVACGAINSAALLLRSVSDRHPRGLANGSDVVGRHYMGHINSVLMALSRCPNPTVFQKSLALNDFYFGSADWAFPMGHISFVGKLDGVTLSAGAPAIAPGWTLDLMGKHSLDFWLTSEDLPDPDNRVTLDGDGRIVLAYTPNNGEGHKRLTRQLERMMQQQSRCALHGSECHQGLFSRNLFVGQRIPLAGVAHQNGTVRFGSDPSTSALDPNCRAHEVDNLYVVDGSFFPSSGAVNPALTIMANALRVGDHILERLGGRASSSSSARNVATAGAGSMTSYLLPARWRRAFGMTWALAVLAVVGTGSPSHQAVAAASPATAGVQDVAMVGFTVGDMDRSLEFYTRVLDFEKVSDDEVLGPAYEELHGVFGARLRVVRLRLGEEYLQLTEYLTPKGRPIPLDSRSNDRWFQHVAIIVRDMGQAYARLRRFKVQHASTAPQLLPETIPGAAGIRAFYFKDPDGHPLEVLQFPPDKGDAKWHRETGRLFLGIDHTAIVVRNTGASLAFYRDVLGFRVAGESMNFGTEQEHLNNVRGARLHITALRAARGPGIEFLEYLTPGDGRAYPADARPNDLVHWETTVLVPDAAAAAAVVRRGKFRLLSPAPVKLPDGALGFREGFLARDPDGHAVQLVEP